MNSSAATASSVSGPIRSNMVNGMQTLRTELDLARASQLTLLRLQLALHKSNRRAAMQALDDLLDIDAEMEGLAATLSGSAAHAAGNATLSGFIELQKAAIAAEKHVLTGNNLQRDAPSIAIAAPGDEADDADFPAQPPLREADAESADRTSRKRWLPVLAAAVVVIVLGYGLVAYLWPALSGAAGPF